MQEWPLFVERCSQYQRQTWPSGNTASRSRRSVLKPSTSSVVVVVLAGLREWRCAVRPRTATCCHCCCSPLRSAIKTYCTSSTLPASEDQQQQARPRTAVSIIMMEPNPFFPAADECEEETVHSCCISDTPHRQSLAMLWVICPTSRMSVMLYSVAASATSIDDCAYHPHARRHHTQSK